MYLVRVSLNPCKFLRPGLNVRHIVSMRLTNNKRSPCINTFTYGRV